MGIIVGFLSQLHICGVEVLPMSFGNLCKSSKIQETYGDIPYFSTLAASEKNAPVRDMTS